MADEEPITNPGSGSGSTTASATSSDSDNSTDSIDLECTASCVAIQWKVQEAFLEGIRVAANENANPNPNPNTTVYDNPPGILLNNFNEGWNRGVDNAGLVHTIDFPQVVTAFWSAAYNAGLILESLYDDSPKALPTSDYQELISAWELAGYYAGTCHMMEQYHYEKHLHIATFMDFFTNRKF